MNNEQTETKRVTITDGFEEAVDRYIDENKPDPLSLRQLQGLSLEWKEQEAASNSCPFDPSHVLQGDLHIGGEHVLVTLKVVCAWKSDENPRHGSFFYSIHASARFWTKEEFKNRKSKDDEDSKSQKLRQKIHSKMVLRLRKDSYISKISSDDDKEDNSQKESGLLAQAIIHVNESNLEERVDVSEHIAEAIRRAIWSSAETPLDVVELILQFPSLPTTIHTKGITGTTALANRASLRLLEDAMVDACEQAGEDQILEDLAIDSEKKEEDTSSSDQNASRNKRKKVKS